MAKMTVKRDLASLSEMVDRLIAMRDALKPFHPKDFTARLARENVLKDIVRNLAMCQDWIEALNNPQTIGQGDYDGT